VSSDRMDNLVSDQALIREVLPNNWPKRVARLLSVPVRTAKHWVYVRVGATRRAELACELLAVMDEQDRRRAELRRQLEAMAHGESAERVAEPAMGMAGRRRGAKMAAADRTAVGKAAR
jgi:hypothetical protein